MADILLDDGAGKTKKVAIRNGGLHFELFCFLNTFQSEI
jgi:hypothetical protein